MTIKLTNSLAVMLVYRLADAITINLKDQPRSNSGVIAARNDIKTFWLQVPPQDRPWIIKTFRNAFQFYRNLYK